MRRPLWRTLGLVSAPFVGMCLSVPLWDRVHPVVLGMPFNLFWISAWIPLTSLCLYAAKRIESGRPRATRPRP